MQKSEYNKRPFGSAGDLAKAKCGNGIGLTRRIPAAEKIPAAAEKVAGKEKHRELGRGFLGSVGTDRDNRVG